MTLLQFFSVFISGILLIYAVYYLIKTDIVRDKFEHFTSILGSADINKSRALRGWKQILKRLKIGEPAQIKMAVLEADKILNEMLKMAGYPGKDLDERLELADTATISNVNELRQAHKIKNRLAAESDFNVNQEEAVMILKIYQKTFQDFNLM